MKDEAYSEPAALVPAPVVDSRLSGIFLDKGGHSSRESGMCAMEAVAFLANEPHSDRPKCACPIVSSFIRRVNDRVDDDTRQGLLELLPQLIGSRSENRDTWIKRGYVFADFAVRRVLPELLEFLGKADAGARLRALGQVTDRATAELARQEARSVRDILKAAAASASAADAAASSAAYAAYAASAASSAAAYAADAAYAVVRRPAFRAKLFQLALAAIKEALGIKP